MFICHVQSLYKGNTNAAEVNILRHLGCILLRRILQNGIKFYLKRLTTSVLKIVSLFGFLSLILAIPFIMLFHVDVINIINRL